jgi:hypothetical protein
MQAINHASIVAFNFPPSRIASDLTLMVSCVLNRLRWPLLGTTLKEWMANKSDVNFHNGDPEILVDGRVDNLSKHVGFIK